MRALKFDGSLAFVQNARVPLRDGEALIGVICAGICNTDLEIIKGYARFQGIPGHEFVGRVIESPDAAQVGKRVAGEINAGCGLCQLCSAGDARHCPSRTVLGIKGRDGAFAEFLSLPAENLIEIPDSISDQEAVFVEPLAASFNILEQVALSPSMEVAVIGDGKLAQLITRVISQTGCRLSVFGKHEEKLELMRSISANCFRVNSRGDGLDSSDRDISFSQSKQFFDVVIEASGSARGLSLAVGLVKPKGKIVLKSTHHNPTLVDLSLVVVNEVQVIGSRCGRFFPAIDLLANGRIDVRPLISAVLPLEEGLFAFDQAAAPESMKIILRVS
jgi:threonine dehydrogenase-like Zn-dependent dehydrogenase